MFISDVLRTKGHHVESIHTTDSVETAVRKLSEHRIGALVVEDRWMKPVGVFSERDFINAVSRNGAAVLHFEVQQLMSTPILTCRPSDRIDAVLDMPQAHPRFRSAEHTELGVIERGTGVIGPGIERDCLF